MYRFIEDPDNKESCEKCCCDLGKFCDSDKCAIAEKITGKVCTKKGDKGYFVETEK